MKKILKGLLVVLLLLASCSAVINPPNIIFINKFNKNFDQIQKLKQMIIADQNLRGIGRYNTGEEHISYFDETKQILSKERKEEYHAILDKLKIHGLAKDISENSQIEVSYGLYRWGGGVGGSAKRYYWYKNKPDKLKFNESSVNVTLTPIKDNWYLSYEAN